MRPASIILKGAVPEVPRTGGARGSGRGSRRRGAPGDPPPLSGIRRWPEGRSVYDLARQIVLIVIPITTEVVDLARHLLDEHEGLMARDALHAAVARMHGAQAICS